MEGKSIKVTQIESTSSRSKGLIERWEALIPQRSPKGIRSGFRALGLFRTDSVNFSLAEAAQKRLRGHLPQ